MQQDVPGVDLVELIGLGTLGEVWRGTDRSSGQQIAVRRLEAGGLLEELQRRAALLRALPGGHGSLEQLLHRCGPLSIGQVVTAVAPIALSLAEAHLRGLTHGRLTAREVLLTHDGKPLLDGLALSFLYDAEPGTGDDIRALRALISELLGAAAPSELEEALDAATDVAELGHLLLRVCPAEPLTGLVSPDPPVLVPLVPAPPVPRPRRRRRPALLALFAALLVVSGLALTRRAPVAISAKPATDWRAVLTGLDEARAAAFAAADPLALAQVYVVGTHALATDRAALQQLTDRHLTARGLRHVVTSVDPLRSTALRADLQVAEALSGFDLVGVDGQVQHTATGSVVRRVVVLRRTQQGWRVESTSG
jgi:hypothetical protein